jgi:hypothetical protein
MDLCWKLIQRYFKINGILDEASIRTQKDLFREAGKMPENSPKRLMPIIGCLMTSGADTTL